jgi:hypothetical protein
MIEEFLEANNQLDGARAAQVELLLFFFICLEPSVE